MKSGNNDFTLTFGFFKVNDAEDCINYCFTSTNVNRSENLSN